MAFPTIVEVEGNISVLVSGALQAWPAMVEHFDPIVLVDPPGAHAIVAICTKRGLANLLHEQGPEVIALAGAKRYGPLARTLRGVFGHRHCRRPCCSLTPWSLAAALRLEGAAVL